MTTGQSEKLAIHGEVKRGSPYLEPKAPPIGGEEAPSARSGFFTRWSVLLTVRPAAPRRWLAWLLNQPAMQLATELASDASGRWALREQRDGPWHSVALTHYWRGPFWVTLAFAATSDSPNITTNAPRRWTLTLWRSNVAAGYWRTLNVLLRAARQPHTAAGAA